MPASNVTYVYICANYWGKGTREAEARRNLERERGQKLRKGRDAALVYRFTGPDHAKVYVDGMGHLCYDRYLHVEELGPF